MPSIEIKSNVPLPNDKFPTILSKFAAETLNKPEQYITTSYVHVPNMTFAGTQDPAFVLLIVSLDNLSPEKNIGYSKAFFEFFEQHLGTKNDRGYITFHDPGRAYLGHQGTTFSSIFGK